MIKCISVKGLVGDVRDTRQRVSWAKNPRIRANRRWTIFGAITLPILLVVEIIALVVKFSTPEDIVYWDAEDHIMKVERSDGKVLRDLDVDPYVGHSSHLRKVRVARYLPKERVERQSPKKHAER